MKKYETRLLGHPQPQMYPPVALYQYTWVNRTHKHFIYICFKAPQTFGNRFHTKAILPTCKMFGGPGEAYMLNPEVLKCHEDSGVTTTKP